VSIIYANMFPFPLIEQCLTAKSEDKTNENKIKYIFTT